MTTHIVGNKDKSAWPAFQTLPANLPAPAATRQAKYPVADRFTVGSFATAPLGSAYRIATAEDLGNNDPSFSLSLLAGRDPGAALAAAAQLAATALPEPGQHGEPGAPVKDPTFVGVFQARNGAFMLTPLYYAPGTNDSVSYESVQMTSATTPEARFRFTDTTLAAVVGTDGMVVNPDHAATFATLTK